MNAKEKTMLYKTLLSLLAVMMLGAVLVGCPGPGAADEAGAGAGAATEVAPMETYQRKAKETISEANADAELERLGKEIEKELAE